MEGGLAEVRKAPLPRLVPLRVDRVQHAPRRGCVWRRRPQARRELRALPVPNPVVRPPSRDEHRRRADAAHNVLHWRIPPDPLIPAGRVGVAPLAPERRRETRRRIGERRQRVDERHARKDAGRQVGRG